MKFSAAGNETRIRIDTIAEIRMAKPTIERGPRHSRSKTVKEGSMSHNSKDRIVFSRIDSDLKRGLKHLEDASINYDPGSSSILFIKTTIQEQQDSTEIRLQVKINRNAEKRGLSHEKAFQVSCLNDSNRGQGGRYRSSPYKSRLELLGFTAATCRLRSAAPADTSP